jgi:hypothetical protein
MSGWPWHEPDDDAADPELLADQAADLADRDRKRLLAVEDEPVRNTGEAE